MLIQLNIDPKIYSLLREQAQENDEAMVDYMARKLSEAASVPDAHSAPQSLRLRIRNLRLRK